MNPFISKTIAAILDDEQVQIIHQKSLELLESVGIRAEGEQVLALLHKNGCTTKPDGMTVIPHALVRRCLESAPKSLTLYDRDGNPNMLIDQTNQKYFGSLTDGLEFFDPHTGELRPYTLEDSSMICKLCDALDNISYVVFTGVYYGPRTEVHTQLFFYNTITQFSKTIALSTNEVPALVSAIEIAKIIAGGAEQLAAKPFLFHYCEPIPPLGFPYDTTERIRLAAEAGIPIVSMPYSMMGGTAPMSAALALVQNNAEVLAGLVISQLVRPGVGYIYGSMPTILDMQSTIGSYGAPEFYRNVNASAQMSDYYGLPFFGTIGGSDARVIDEQACAEAMMEIMAAVTGKQNIIHDLGMMDHASNVNPKYLLLLDELIEIAKVYAGGINFDETNLNLDIIRRSYMAGHYMDDDHTLENFREVRYSEVFSRKMVNPLHSEVMQKLDARLFSILDHHVCKPMDAERLAKLEQYLEQFDIQSFYKSAVQS